VLTWDDATTRWTTALAAASRSPRTIRLYASHLRKLATAHPDGPTTVTTDDLRAVLATQGWSPEYRKSLRTAYVGFYTWLVAEGLADTNPAARLDVISVPQGVARPAPEYVITRALAGADERVRTMILLAAYAGLRDAEIATVSPLNYDGNGLYVTGKGGKTRYVPIIREDLAAILRTAQRNGQPWLFPGQIDGHLSPEYVCRLLSRALPGKWTGHTLRHRCATQMFAGTHDLLAVGAVLGHSRPETTQRYVRMPTDALTAAVAAAA
jgi:site-specific recombinase XerD